MQILSKKHTRISVIISRSKLIFFVDFSATVTNLQAKVESLTTTNALMKEDLAIAKNNILSVQEENRQLKKELGIEVKDANEVYIYIYVKTARFMYNLLCY